MTLIPASSEGTSPVIRGWLGMKDAAGDASPFPPENHFVNRIGWLRAAVLGANDGLLSVSSLMVGVTAAAVDRPHLLLTGVAGIVAGAMSMAAGEYVSVSSQADSEKAHRARASRACREP